MVYGVITKADIEWAPHAGSERGNPAWTPIIWYSYEVNGVAYQGRTEMKPWYVNVRTALAGADDLVGKAIRVRYNGEVPAKSAWLQSDGGSGQLAHPAKPDPVTGLISLSLK